MLLVLVLGAHAGPRADALRDALAATRLTGLWVRPAQAWGRDGPVGADCAGVRVTATSPAGAATCVRSDAGVACAPVADPDADPSDLCPALVEPAPAWLAPVLAAVDGPDRVSVTTQAGAALVHADAAVWLAVPTPDGLRLARRLLWGTRAPTPTITAVHDATPLTGGPAWGVELTTEDGGTGARTVERWLTVVDLATTIAPPMRVGATLWSARVVDGARVGGETVRVELGATFLPGLLRLAITHDDGGPDDERRLLWMTRENTGDWRVAGARLERVVP